MTEQLTNEATWLLAWIRKAPRTPQAIRALGNLSQRQRYRWALQELLTAGLVYRSPSGWYRPTGRTGRV